MSLRDEVALTISSCDKFSDLWNVHFQLLSQNWEHHPKETLLVTDCETEKSFSGIYVFSAGDNLEFPARLKEALKEINAQYVFLTLDDYFVISNIDDNKLDLVFAFIKENDIDYFRLFPIPNNGTPTKENKKWKWIDLNTNYAVNLYPGIWKKAFLEKALESNLSPWQFEVTLTQTAKDNRAKCVMSKCKEYPILDVVRKGKVLRKANRYLKKNGFDIGNRPIIPFATELKLNIIGYGSRILPPKIAKGIRGLLHKFGMSFYSDGSRK